QDKDQRPEESDFHRSYLDSKLGAAARNLASKQPPKKVDDMQERGLAPAAEKAKKGDIEAADAPRKAAEEGAAGSANERVAEDINDAKDKTKGSMYSATDTLSSLKDTLLGKSTGNDNR
ncbi:hypothetical protein GOP47_0009451, partial [Adiantum capillus-veneris]